MADVEPIGISVDPNKAVSGIRAIRDAMKELVAGFKEGYETTMQAEQKIGEPLEKASTEAVAKGVAIGEALSEGISKGLEVLSEALKEAMSEESMKVGFGALIDNAQEAEKVLEELKEFGLGTGVSIKGLDKAAFDMAAAGVDAKALAGDLKDLANVAAAGIDPGKSLQELVRTFDQVRESNQVTVRTLTQLKTAGFDAIDAIARYEEVSAADVFQMVKAGQVGWDTLNAAMKESTEEGGRYFDLANERAKTFGGQMALMQQQTSQMLTDFVGGLLPALNQMLTAFRSLTAEGTIFSDLAAEIKTEVQSFADGFTTLVNQIKQFNGWRDFLDAGKLVMAEIGVALLTALINAIQTAATALSQLIANAKAGFSFSMNPMTGNVGWSGFSAPTVPRSTLGEDTKQAASAGLDDLRTKIAEETAARQKSTDAITKETQWNEKGNKAEMDALAGGGEKPGARTDALGAPPGKGGGGGGGGGAQQLTALEKEWSNIQKAIDDYNNGLSQGMTHLEATDQLMANLKKDFDKAYDHANIDQWIDAQLTGYENVKAHALNADAARVQSAKRADEDIKLGIESTYDTIIASITKATEAASNLDKVLQTITTSTVTNFASGFADAFTSFIDGTKSAKQAFSDFAKSFLDQISKMIIQQLILMAINKAIGMFGGGGVVGTGDTGPTSDANYVATAQGRFADGGMVSWSGAPHFPSGGGIPSIAHAGEVILNAAQQNNVAAAMGNGGSGKVNNAISISVHNYGAQGGGTQSTSKSNADAQSTALARQLEGEVVKVVNNHLRYGGVLSKSNPAFAAAIS